MTLRNFFTLLFSAFILFATVNFIHGMILDDAFEQKEKIRAQRDEILKTSEYLLASSQWMTNLSKEVVATRSPELEASYQYIIEILNGNLAMPAGYGFGYWDLVSGGKIPPMDGVNKRGITIEDRFLALKITAQEFLKLEKVRKFLSRTETQERIAMNAVFGRYDDGGGSFLKKGKPDPLMAQKILHGQEYKELNGELALAVQDFNDSVINRYSETLSTQNKYIYRLVSFNKYFSALLFGVIFMGSIFIHRRFNVRVRQLATNVENIDPNDPKSVAVIAGRDEISDISRKISALSERLKVAITNLNEKITIADNAVEELESERNRSEKLLHNILPSAIADRLKGGEGSIAEIYPEVTVFFSDIVGFTELAANLGPQATVNILNGIFDRFDELAEKHGVEKIKTIGDCYMAVGGVPTRDPMHCQHIAEFALEAMKATEALSDSFGVTIRMRMGIHTGTVAAGVVGKKKFSYDLWGDVVNVASRFESTSEPDRIHTSEAVKVRLSDDFVFLNSRTVELKGKGIVSSYFLVGKKDDTSQIIQFSKNN